jgi:hypothetical protein
VQFLNDVKQKGAKLLVDNASVLLTAAGVVGTVSTAVLAGRAGFKAADILREMKYDASHDENGDRIDVDVAMSQFHIPVKDKIVKIGPHFIPPVVTGTATVAAIIMGHRVSAQKAAALAAAYGLAERNLSEYKEKVAQHLTGPKKEKLETEIAQDKVNAASGSDRIILVDGSDEVLCFDTATDRYFKSSPEKIRRAVNATNAEILNHGGANAAYFYSELELSPTQWGNECGWGIGEQMDVKFDYVEASGNRPCLSITFEKMPSPNWLNPYS